MTIKYIEITFHVKNYIKTVTFETIAKKKTTLRKQNDMNLKLKC